MPMATSRSRLVAQMSGVVLSASATGFGRRVGSNDTPARLRRSNGGSPPMQMKTSSLGNTIDSCARASEGSVLRMIVTESASMRSTLLSITSFIPCSSIERCSRV